MPSKVCPGKPASAAVGTAGAAGERTGLATASMRSRPACGSAVAEGSIKAWMRPSARGRRRAARDVAHVKAAAAHEAQEAHVEVAGAGSPVQRPGPPSRQLDQIGEAGATGSAAAATAAKSPTPEESGATSTPGS